MREFKFRAWSEETKTMYYSHRPNGTDNPLWSYDAVFRSHNPKTHIMQYTGLKDKNGEEIYEGDIVIMWYDLIERWSAPLLVTFDVLVIEDDFGATWEPMCWRVGDSELSGICEIVGNIHENPELLEEVNK